MRMRVVTVVLGALLLSGCAQDAGDAPLQGEALLARGDYLVNGVVLCGDCHTPRGSTGEPDMARHLQGGELPPGPPGFATVAPQLAGRPANYIQEHFIAFLQTGVRPDGSRTRPPMPPYRLNEDDARAVDAYIAALPQAASQ